MNANTTELTDGFLALPGGMHGGMDPLAIPAESGVYARGVNVTAREGTLQTRPAFVRHATLTSGKFQGAGVWRLESCDRIAYVVDGRLYSLRLDTLETIDHGACMSPAVDRVNYVQAFKWLVVQDGTSAPVALEEDGAGNAVVYTRGAYVNSDSPPAALCLPPGTVSAYAHGRIHVVPTVVPDLAPLITDESSPSQLNALPTYTSGASGRACFVSSDPLDIYVPEFIFRMGEHRNLNEGGAIELPAEIGFIYGMAPLRNAASGTGVGPLLVFGREGVCAFDVSIARSEWKNVNIGQVLFSTIGTRSPYSLTQINNDIGFIDTEKRLRTVQFERSSVSNSLTSLPMSHELDPFHKADTTPYLGEVSMSFVDSRLTWTLAGDPGPSYRALASLDFAKVYAMGQSVGPSFDGIWTGFDFQQTLAARDASGAWRHFVVVKGAAAGENLLYVLDEAAVRDNGTSRIQSMVWTRFMDFQAAVDTKALQQVEIWLSGIATDTTLSVYFRPRGVPGWSLIGSRTFQVPGGEPQTRRRVMIPLTVDDIGCEPVSNEKLSVATHFQFAIVWQGRLKIDRFRAVATLRRDPPTSCLDADNPDLVEVTAGTELDDFAYRAL